MSLVAVPAGRAIAALSRVVAALAMVAVLAISNACLLPPSCAAPLPLGPVVALPVGQLPLDVAIGDVNGDGAPDLVSADARSHRLSVLLGRGDGTFQPAIGVTHLAIVPHLVALADVDGDGDLDAIASDHDGAGVAVLIGTGDGGFAAAPGSPFPSHQGTPHNHGLAVGDVSGDGVPDVITANQVDRSISVLLGDGRGGLAPAPQSPLRLSGEPYVTRLADVDGDGHLDIVAPLISAAAVVVLRGDGRGGFAPVPGSPYPALARPYTVAVGDLDDDGLADVVLAHDDTDRLSVFAGRPAGPLVPATGSPFRLGQRAFVVAIADVDANGAADLVAAGGDQLILLTRQPGQGPTQACRTALPQVAGWTAVAGHLDGDLLPDLVVADGTGNQLTVVRFLPPAGARPQPQPQPERQPR